MTLVKDEEKKLQDTKYSLFTCFGLKSLVLYFVIICSIKTAFEVENIGLMRF